MSFSSIGRPPAILGSGHLCPSAKQLPSISQFLSFTTRPASLVPILVSLSHPYQHLGDDIGPPRLTRDNPFSIQATISPDWGDLDMELLGIIMWAPIPGKK